MASLSAGLRPGDRLRSVAPPARCAMVLFAAVLCLCGCPKKDPLPDACVCVADAGAASTTAQLTPPAQPIRRPEPTTAVPHVEPLAVCEAKGQLPLDAARTYFDAKDYPHALSCAAQAAALQPNEVLAHVEKANALSALERYEEARMAYARALAQEPDSLDALLGAAHLYAVALPSSRENDELGSLYAERGLEQSRQQKDDETAIQFARLSAMAFNDLGQSADALDRAEWVLAQQKDDAEAKYERAMALFELCRFDEARAAFKAMVNDPDRAAHAHHHLGLLLERDGRQKEADQHFAKAHALDEADFPEPVILSVEEFNSEVKKAVAALPDDMKKDVRDIPIEAEDLPRGDDLTSGEPPLSPTILGLFRGPPLGTECGPDDHAGPNGQCRSVALYRKNLGRAVKSKEELIEQIRVTLLHEIGHLRGEDDFELAARGLE